MRVPWPVFLKPLKGGLMNEFEFSEPGAFGTILQARTREAEWRSAQLGVHRACRSATKIETGLAN